jgi:lysyl-tRNA synthetase, class II
MDYRNTDEFIMRTRKLHEIRALGVEPYPYHYSPTHDSIPLHEQYDETKVGDSAAAEAGATPLVCVAGRLVLFRPMGKNSFGTIQDKSGRIQIMCNREVSEVVGLDTTKETHGKFIEKKLDLGDIIGVEGHLFHTHKGELTIFVKKLTLLCKSLLPLPEKHSGLVDKEIRYRKRWLDLISNSEVTKTFRMRSQMMSLIRRHFEDLGFIEVETPVLQTIYGGAQAKPFLTKLNALDQLMYMRIALEISLKKLLVGGLDRVFEIGKVFRNEGLDKNHNPEFTILEAYAAMWDYNDMMRLVETLYEKIALALHETTVIAINHPERNETIRIDLKTPWKRMTMKESIREYAQLDPDTLSCEQMTKILLDAGMNPDELKGTSRGLLIAHLFETFVEEKLIQPHHITDHPIETTPLAKPHRDPVCRQEGLIERFESFILGQEMCNAYSELNDPEIQRKLLEEQAARLSMGDEEANPLDEDFIEAICQGHPPAGGIGIGLDRMIMLFTNSSSIRDVLFFPWMKPQA